MAMTTCKLVWLKSLLCDLLLVHPQCILPYYDNGATLHITHNPLFHERTKLIGLNCHFVCEKYLCGLILHMHVSISFN